MLKVIFCRGWSLIFLLFLLFPFIILLLPSSAEFVSNCKSRQNDRCDAFRFSYPFPTSPTSPTTFIDHMLWSRFRFLVSPFCWIEIYNFLCCLVGFVLEENCILQVLSRLASPVAQTNPTFNRFAPLLAVMAPFEILRVAIYVWGDLYEQFEFIFQTKP